MFEKCGIKDLNDLKIELHVKYKTENNCHGVKNMEFKFSN